MKDAATDVPPAAALPAASVEGILASWDARVREGGGEPLLAPVAREVLETLSGGTGVQEVPARAETPAARAVMELTLLRAVIAERHPELATEAGAAIDAALLREVTRSCSELQAGFDEASRDRHKLLSVVAHDLKNPLNTILLSIAVLEGTGSAVTDPIRRTLGTVGRSARRMNRLIDDLLDLRSIQTGRMTVDPAPRDPLALLRAAEAACGTEASDKGLALEVEAASGLPAVRADQPRVLQVLSNLLSNAVKATPQGRVVVGADAKEDGEVVFWVADTGPGIAPEHRELVFEPYWRAPDVSYTGTGLGLAVSRGIVAAHGGRMWIEENEGGGTRVLFTLPAETAPASQA